jgi:hypothetical protein
MTHGGGSGGGDVDTPYQQRRRELADRSTLFNLHPWVILQSFQV